MITTQKKESTDSQYSMNMSVVGGSYYGVQNQLNATRPPKMMKTPNNR